ncbi:unnamed protein product [Prunus armeniaca]|uniref:Uncharacterized protein n=1 Tax=Prunus armeniaca TaxID=36596 RepID=A0A6J5WP56_PRUAR|nr:unnamed protein product [Prunus armeniaca]CAB4303470.1 unnamed protein product [Prunus armeniaca]
MGPEANNDNENHFRGKTALRLTLQNVIEPPSLEPKPEGDIGASSPFLQSNPNGGPNEEGAGQRSKL